jgi:hypothetical protein
MTEIPIANDPDESSALDNREVTDLMSLGQVPGFAHTRIRLDRNHIRGHMALDRESQQTPDPRLLGHTVPPSTP